MSGSATQVTEELEPPAEVPAAPRPTPLQTLVRVGLTGLLLYLVFGVLIPEFAGYAEIWGAIRSLSRGEVALLLGLFVLLELLKPLTNDILVPGLGLRHALAASQSS